MEIYIIDRIIVLPFEYCVVLYEFRSSFVTSTVEIVDIGWKFESGVVFMFLYCTISTIIKIKVTKNINLGSF